MADHSHRFIEEFEGFIGFGLNPESDMDAVTYYLQKFSDDQLMTLLRTRLTDEDRQAIFDLLSGLLRKHLTEPEYHRYFLKDNPNP
ncbi:MAG: cytoplasmic protein [Desulfobacteraceae bacterium]|nr:cytoplasmic protein [Desulfobacteraceae bacterium]